ncbi:MAG: phosphate acetyltransferase [Clostridiales bacterium]|jgi:phosphate acetyltransferase|nr:phosphate acetyltransferase [Clostridiales bacterium]
MNFLESIKARAAADVKSIVLPEAGDIRTLKAAAEILKQGFAKVILVGSADKIAGDGAGLDLAAATIIDPANYDKRREMAQRLAQLRKSKGMTVEQADELLDNELYFGVMLVDAGIADGMVAGAANSTADVLRPSLQILKTAPGTKLVSSFFIMVVPDCDLGADGIFLFSDCGLNQNPNAEEMASIAVSSAESFRVLTGQEPVVAMLSHSSKGSAKHADVDKVVEATKIAKEAAPHLALDGEFQLDAAIVPEIGAAKAKGSPVAGKANCLIFPDLDAGNIGYKLVERLAKAAAYGPVTQGIAKPVNDLSRGCSYEDIVGVAAITAVQAQGTTPG